LECCRSISKTIRNDKVFKKSKMSAESSFPLVTFMDMKVAVSRFEINNQKHFAALNTIKKIVDKGNRVVVFVGDGIETTKIDAKRNIPSLFVDEKNRSSCRRGGMLNVTTFEIGVDIFNNGLSLYKSKSINQTKRR
jgi:hypothetical protein